MPANDHNKTYNNRADARDSEWSCLDGFSNLADAARWKYRIEGSGDIYHKFVYAEKIGDAIDKIGSRYKRTQDKKFIADEKAALQDARTGIPHQTRIEIDACPVQRLQHYLDTDKPQRILDEAAQPISYNVNPTHVPNGTAVSPLAHAAPAAKPALVKGA